MNDVAPILLPLAEPPRPDRRILATAAVSVLVHLLVLGWILLPRAPTTQAEEPQSIAVELVPPSEVSSVEPSISSQPPPSSQEPPSTEPSSEASSSMPSASPSSQASSAEPPSSQAPSSAEQASSAEPPSSVQPSAASSTPPPPSESSVSPPSGASSAETSSSAEAASASSSASQQPPPAPRAKPTVIPVGPGASASEEVSSFEDASASQDSSAASAVSSEEASSAEAASTAPVLMASGEGGEGVDQAIASGSSEAPSASAEGAPPPPASDLLHAAKRFYLSEMLNQPGLANAKAALKKLPPEKRLAQTCNIEAVGQIGKARGDYSPDAVVANAFAPTTISGTTYTVASGAFRSNGKWYGIAYECTLSTGMTAVSSFAFHIGDDVTKQMVARYGGG